MKPDVTSPAGAGSATAPTDQRDLGPESLATLLGGRRTSIDAMLPPLAFVVGWSLADQSVGIAAGVAIGVSALLAGYRLARGIRPRAALIGLLGVTVAAMIVLYTGRPEDYFLPRLLTNAVSALAWTISIVLRWPLLGVVVGTVLRQRGSWRRDPDLLRAYSLASWVWVPQYVLRTVIFGALYYLGWVAALGVAQVALTYPLVAACVAISAVVLRRALPSDHPGLRQVRPRRVGPEAPGSGPRDEPPRAEPADEAENGSRALEPRDR